ncbi:hypothetical protein CWS43_24190 [Rahnella sp. AA]|nr:hypothetical protein CWS43_24190 [Rahnella sp. AA]
MLAGFDLLLPLSRGEGWDGVLVLAAQWPAKPPPGLPLRRGRSKLTARKRLQNDIASGRFQKACRAKCFETYGSKTSKGTAQRQVFAAITIVSET